MRLLNIKTLKLESYNAENTVPPYVILSHTWGEDEVLFEDLQDTDQDRELYALSYSIKDLDKRLNNLQQELGMTNGESDDKRPVNEGQTAGSNDKVPVVLQEGTNQEHDSSRSDSRLSRVRKKQKGWMKITGCCREAETFGFSYVWIDTCCIDKSSSSELSESINSMFLWYKNAGLCVAYLSDISSGNEKEFANSKWFLRGWTLQELIAPDDVWFYDKEWEFIGPRSALTAKISSITMISKAILDKNCQEKMAASSIAARLSWAAGRKTTRAEDRAYSLLGIFGINMPTIYGEGEQAAFFRLQIEIFKALPDHSIFAWSYPFEEWGSVPKGDGVQMFAPRVDLFAGAGSIECAPYSKDDYIYQQRTCIPGHLLQTKFASGYSRFSHGICVTLLLCPMGSRGTRGSYFRACLACKVRGSNKPISVDILEEEDGSFLRVLGNISEVEPSALIEGDWSLKDVYLPHLSLNISKKYQSHARWSTYNLMRINDEQIISHGLERIPSNWKIPNISTPGALNPYGGSRGGAVVVDLLESINDSGYTRIGSGYGALMYRDILTMDLFAIVLNFGSYYGVQVAVMDHFNTLHDDRSVYPLFPQDGDGSISWEDLSRHAICKQLKRRWHVFVSKSPSASKTLGLNIRVKSCPSFELPNDEKAEENNFRVASVRISVSQWTE